ncbi:MAG: molybdopterin-dependent oxidoreductase [Coriobacteriia bacterium]
MTNHWNDIANATLVFAIGCNPAENHPAVFNHINHARFSTASGNPLKPNAKLIVVDPRKTRTALQCDTTRGDRYVRIRPGTDIAFINGVINYIITTVEALADGNAVKTAYKAFLNDNSSVSRTFTADDGTEVINTLASGGAWTKYTDARVKTSGYTYSTTNLTIGGKSVTGILDLAADITDSSCVYQKLKHHVSHYDSTAVVDICGCTAEDITFVGDAFIANSRCSSTSVSGGVVNESTYRVATLLYAMGATQHTVGSENIRAYAVLQTMMGNMGRAGGGINALRGIHNVQGSTDMGNLFDSIPGYSGNPTMGQTFPQYLNLLFGWRTETTGSYTRTVDPWLRKDPLVPGGNVGMQQVGFFNMTQAWFGDRTLNPSSSGEVTQAKMEAWFGQWPRGNGTDHINAFREMANGDIRACYVWGQNPAVTEPNQAKVRAGLKNLDMLVVQDMFETETAACDRKGSGVTYLLPACSHVEEAGSVTNSGRWIQWRERARAPKESSKSDMEWLLRFAKALNDASAFSHIKVSNGWADNATTWTKLYARYGWTPTAATDDFEALSLNETATAGGAGRILYGSEVVAQNVYKEMCSPLAPTFAGATDEGALTAGSTVWIYYEAYNTSLTGSQYEAANGYTGPAFAWSAWTKNVKARNRDATTGPSLTYNRWGWAWLKNRRVFYNNAEVHWDVADNFVNAGYLGRLFLNDWTGPVEWTGKWTYREFKKLSDKPSVSYGSGIHEFARIFPAHTEPYETPRDDLALVWGKNTTGGTPTLDLLSTTHATTPTGSVATGYPLVLTTIRCVEHFQGGPVTRNNPFNVEAEPEPWVEINSVDARRFNIVDGDMVNVITARSNSTSNQNTRTNREGSTASDPCTADTFAAGFKARVGVGLASNQRVAQGVVAIPWHWGDRGLSQGSRANDLCIDAMDANTKIPEYKACLCRIEKIS